MKPEWNENTYEQQFDSSLRRGPKSRPVPVVTNLRLMDQATTREISIYAVQGSTSPQYDFECDEQAGLHPSLRALGRHYFTW
jgi:hypothetical protein